MPHYKLMYFNLRGRAEIIRYLFAYSGIKYEDHRIEQVDWPKIKPTIPFGKIPILEVDGVTLHQSLAIARYLAKETGLAGQTPLEQALVDAIVDTIDDFVSLFPWGEKNQDVKQQTFNDLLTNTAPGLLRDLDCFLGDNKWLVGKSVSIFFPLPNPVVNGGEVKQFHLHSQRPEKHLLSSVGFNSLLFFLTHFQALTTFTISSPQAWTHVC
ncbi:hematopoietic prostaglandin D synthase isoform X1 [Chelonoidis abingdonii]|uniref:hematopoietic prostaglandin D synthase isoform X1 n=1 Tax=Chelonoidis abingdonii TaxID=106734 RepID=UPI0013F1A783|nr:hematopoietic prostaglandin D synthase isoform X1 [Chelonoidis abingdonii]